MNISRRSAPGNASAPKYSVRAGNILTPRHTTLNAAELGITRRGYRNA
jgi:hypothetical protein